MSLESKVTEQDDQYLDLGTNIVPLRRYALGVADAVGDFFIEFSIPGLGWKRTTWEEGQGYDPGALVTSEFVALTSGVRIAFADPQDAGVTAVFGEIENANA